jgi:hypothetical protein
VHVPKEHLTAFEPPSVRRVRLLLIALVLAGAFAGAFLCVTWRGQHLEPPAAEPSAVAR